MSSRGHRQSTLPMDFEWENKTGPVDASSPWVGQSAKKREHFASPLYPNNAQLLSQGPAFGQPGPHSVLESPARSYMTPNRARETDRNASLFSPEKSLSSVPAHVWTLRTPASNYDASSGGETPETPQVDSDAGTPDTHMAAQFGRLGTGEPSNKKASRQSWLKRLMGSPSPTKEQKEPKHPKRTENRIAKRRSPEKSERSRSKRRRARNDDDSDSEPGAPPPQSAVKQTLAASTAGVLSWIEAHPHLPSVLSVYLQLFVNTVLGFAVLYLGYSVLQGIRNDIQVEGQKHTAEVMAEIARCVHEYRSNRCEPDQVVPALQNACRMWETCMNRDPKRTALASVTAKTFAIIFNSFVEEFSYKSMIFTFLLLFGGFNLSNWAFGLLRSAAPLNRAHPPNSNDFIPQTPHRVPSNSYLEYSQHQQQQLGYGQNWQYQQGAQQGVHTPYRIEAPPPLVHTQSMPQLPSASVAEAVSVEERRSPRKKGLFR